MDSTADLAPSTKPTLEAAGDFGAATPAVDSSDHDGALHDLVDEGGSDAGVYERFVLDDIRRTADLLAPIYERAESMDGPVSLEV